MIWMHKNYIYIQIVGYTSIILWMGDILVTEYKLIVLICNKDQVKLLFTMLTDS